MRARRGPAAAQGIPRRAHLRHSPRGQTRPREPLYPSGSMPPGSYSAACERSAPEATALSDERRAAPEEILRQVEAASRSPVIAAVLEAADGAVIVLNAQRRSWPRTSAARSLSSPSLSSGSGRRGARLRNARAAGDCGILPVRRQCGALGADPALPRRGSVDRGGSASAHRSARRRGPRFSTCARRPSRWRATASPPCPCATSPRRSGATPRAALPARRAQHRCRDPRVVGGSGAAPSPRRPPPSGSTSSPRSFRAGDPRSPHARPGRARRARARARLVLAAELLADLAAPPRTRRPRPLAVAPAPADLVLETDASRSSFASS